YDQIGKVFGFAGICRAAVCDKTLEDIQNTAREYLPEKLSKYRTFKCESKRSDKHFPLSSPELSGEIGAVILEACPHITVDLREPDVIVKIEVRDEYAYIHAGQDKGAGGMPLGSAGKGMLLLSGGIDSPVAGYMMMKRGMTVECVHFESFPYTSEAAREKVLTLASELTEFCGKIKVHVFSLTHIQEMIRDNCEEDYFTLLLRRFMMRIASRSAIENSCHVLVTGESLGQVASQTLKAMCVTEDAASIPVFRPLIGMDKEEIIKISRAIRTFETSILPYDDCCTVFTPRHPRTQPELEKVLAEEAKLNVDELIEEAWMTRNTVVLEQEI
ncbi:MAG: tRNA 4-thiouridine(8) synthase ThiI, partial [Ruminococcaceae bacterium]|nr:tRNA 4-thiouridine(8) synthase ThiI [Oscillospiraceae bacterium]